MEKRILVQVLSDLHAETNGGQGLPSPEDLATGAQLVVLAGDIAKAADSVQVARRLFPKAEVIVLCGGNHEHYSTMMPIDHGIEVMRLGADEAGLHPRVFVLEDEGTIIRFGEVDVRVLGCTFWTDFGLFGDAEAGAMAVGRALNDHRVIMGDGRPSKVQPEHPGPFALTTDETRERNAASRAFLAEMLDRPHDGPTLVVTHHCPSMRSVSLHYRSDLVSAGFASNADDLLAKGATLWVHGHTHDSFNYRDESGTLVLCNPAGYITRWRIGEDPTRENKRFDPKMVVDVRFEYDEWIAEVVPSVVGDFP